ncbi:MAG TPA: hypothetical protein VFB08_19190 [Burkholderiales bacterium]|nr:hypothetical protein [Burkholderiales bacterium]
MRSRNRFATKFWQKAHASLPARVRREEEFHLRSAERWELRTDAAIELWSRAASALGRLFHMPNHGPRRSPGH